MEYTLNQFELVIGLLFWGWLFASAFLFNFMENRYIDIMHKHSALQSKDLSKNSWTNPLGGFKNLLFFITYKPKDSDARDFVIAVKKGRNLQILYITQLICVVGAFIMLLFKSGVQF